MHLQKACKCFKHTNDLNPLSIVCLTRGFTPREFTQSLHHIIIQACCRHYYLIAVLYCGIVSNLFELYAVKHDRFWSVDVVSRYPQYRVITSCVVCCNCIPEGSC